MAIKRMTAKKVRIIDLMGGKWVKREGMEPSFIITDAGEKVSRARILGTIVQTFLAEDGNFGSVTLDDGSDTIRAKTFKTVKPLDEFNAGDNVDLIGKVREYNGEVYIIPEVITRLADPNMELLRRLELVKKARELKERPSEATPEEAAEGVQVGQSGPQEGAATQEGEAKPAPKEDNSELRKQILEVIGSEPEGVEYGLILEKVKGEEAKIESALNEILSEGICYEPTPGKVKKI
jgi:RPA family protein